MAVASLVKACRGARHFAFGHFLGWPHLRCNDRDTHSFSSGTHRYLLEEKMKHLVFASTLAAAALAFPVSALAQQSATANVIDADGAQIGTVTFNATKSGMLHVVAELTDLPPGPHGFHVHEAGECDAEGGFESAGGHYAGDMDHGVMAEGGPHPGDFPNVNVGQDGVLKAEFFTERLSLEEGGDNPLLDEDGSSVVVHSGPDDYASQPSGDAGDRIACGVIEQLSP
jgi:Cu-Zn family superoxide dismutase